MSNIEVSGSYAPASYMLEPEAKEWLKAEAERYDRSVSWLVRLIISEYRQRQAAALAAQEKAEGVKQ